MVSDLLELADGLFTGALDIDTHRPYELYGQRADVAPRTSFVAAFSNSAAFDTDEGLVVVDTSSQLFCRQVHDALHEWRNTPLHTAVFTHGHIDHCFGVDLYEADAETQGWRAPVVIAHEAIRERFRRYVETAGYNAVINQRQFQLREPYWPTAYRDPDRTYQDRLIIDVGSELFELHHARGETDDHTWVWVPGRRVLCTGDLFIWASPNCGNPQKVQRYPSEWAAALRTMMQLDADVLLPGHGVPVIGAERVRTVLDDAATLLEHLHRETVRMMNDGARLDDILHAVHAPPELLAKPYLRPVYDEPEFVVRNIWRLYGGWYDGNPAHLKPASDVALAAELAALAGGAHALADRALALADSGHEDDLRLASHLAELAAMAAPEDASVHAARADVFDRRVAAEASVMSKGVFSWAASESRAKAGAEANNGTESGR